MSAKNAEAQCSTIPRGDAVVETQPRLAPLQQIIRNACRAAGQHVLFDAEVDNRDVEIVFRGRLSGLFKTLGDRYQLDFEQLGTDTVYVTKAPPKPEPPAENRNDAEPQELVVASAATNNIDDILKMPVRPAAVNAPATGKRTTMLQGSIEHKSQLDPVQRNLRVGTTVNIPKLQSLTPGNVWSRLPNWAAGSWKTLSMTAYYRYNYHHKTKNMLIDTFMDKGTETFGWQRDRNGDLWHFVGTDFYTISEGETDYSVDFHKFHEVPEQDDKHFVVRHVCTRAIVGKKTRKVQRVFQAEALNVYTLANESTIRCKSSIKEFDADGQPASLQKGISYEARVRAYAPWDTHKGKDMRALFREYLLSHGLEQLIN
jgi:hypothetical protein